MRTHSLQYKTRTTSQFFFVQANVVFRQSLQLIIALLITFKRLLNIEKAKTTDVIEPRRPLIAVVDFIKTQNQSFAGKNGKNGFNLFRRIRRRTSMRRAT